MLAGVPEISNISSEPWQKGDSVLPQIVRLKELPPYQEWFEKYLLKNQLCIINADVTLEWNSRRFWVNEDNSPNFNYLSDHFGEMTAPVADCNREEFCAHPKTEMKVKDFLHYWQDFRVRGHPPGEKCLYLKDWHFQKTFPSYNAYKPPAILCSDWMNEFWDTCVDEVGGDDYRFVYMGPKNSWTPFHSDILRSYSWSANICGKKKWIFYPPGKEENLKDHFGQMVFDVTSPDLQDEKRYPKASQSVGGAITVIQNPGEIIFVPSGWYHQVINLEDTISINHNWMNGCSIHLTWEYVKSQLSAVQREIADCKDMDGWQEQCQLILKAETGINYKDFYKCVSTIAKHRVTALTNLQSTSPTLCHCDCDLEMEGKSDPEQTETQKLCTNVSSELVAVNDSTHCYTCPKSSSKCGGQRMLCLYKREKCSTHYLDSGVSGKFNYLRTCEKTEEEDTPECCSPERNTVSRFSACVGDTMCDEDVSLETEKHDLTCTVGTPDLAQVCSDQTSHEQCPHWAHCGSRLALFDLSRIKVIMEDILCETASHDIDILFSDTDAMTPVELLASIETTLSTFGDEGRT